MSSRESFEDRTTSLNLLRALHFRGNEIQLSRALHVICQDPAVASSFLQVILDKAQLPVGARRRRFTVPDDLRCRDEVKLVEVDSLQRAHRRVKELGRVDLSFVAPRFKLHVELKVDSNFGVEQIRRYAKTNERVVAVVRDPEKALSAVGNVGPKWLGACAWSEIVEDLRSLPIADSSAGTLWQDLIEAFQADGEFEPAGTVRRASQQSVELLKAIQPQLNSYLDERLQKRYRRNISEAVGWQDARAGRRWAWLELRIDAIPVLEIGVREGETSSPVIQLNWKAPRTRKLKLAYQKLTRGASAWEKSTYGYTVEKSMSLPADKEARSLDDRVSDEITVELDRLIRAGVFDWDLRAV